MNRAKAAATGLSSTSHAKKVALADGWDKPFSSDNMICGYTAKQFQLAGVADGSNSLGTYEDYSPAGNNLAIAGGIVYREAGLNSLPTLDFSNGNLYASSLKPTTGEIEVFMVLETESTGNIYGPMACSAVSRTSRNHYTYVGGQVYMSFFNNARFATAGLGNVDIDPHILNVYNTGTNLTVRINDSTIINQAATWDESDIFTIGNGGSDRNAAINYDGRISEIIIFDQVLSSEQRTLVKNYLTTEWSL